MTTIRTRDDGALEGVNGPVYPCFHDRSTIAGRMGWADGGNAAPIITRTLELLAEGKAVRLTSRLGTCYFQPLLDTEDGSDVPASREVVYNHEGRVIEKDG